MSKILHKLDWKFLKIGLVIVYSEPCERKGEGGVKKPSKSCQRSLWLPPYGNWKELNKFVEITFPKKVYFPANKKIV